MASFDFWLIGCSQPHRLHVGAADLDELGADMALARFVVGEMEPDEWGEVRRILVAANRIQAVVEAE